MENAFLVSLSHLNALKREMDVIANNLANANTTAFKSDGILFEEYLSKKAEGGAAPEISFVTDYGLVRDMHVGELTQTGNPLDVAVSGKGYFAIQFKDKIAYTRNGHFNINNNGELVTPDGYQVLNDNLNPVKFAPNAPLPEIAADGSISSAGAQAGKLGLFSFDDEQAMQKSMSGLLTTEETRKPLPRGETHLVQGSLENSNVQPVTEMTRMIDVLRKYQTAVQLTSVDDELMRKAIDQLSRVR